MSFVSPRPLSELLLWEKMRKKQGIFKVDYEVTARCNLNCRHCYINLPHDEKNAKENELSLDKIDKIANEIVSKGTIWCLLTGGEPLLRKDFPDIYLTLKQKGLLVSVFTNATLVTNKHIQLFKQYPPKNIEVTVYGVTKNTYEKVTRTPGSFQEFLRGIDLLLANDIKVRFKAMIMRSNVHESTEIFQFCRENTKDYFRFDPFLHLRYDRDPVRNQEIMNERLSPAEIVKLEISDKERLMTLVKNCDDYIFPEQSQLSCGHLLSCGAGKNSFTLNYDGQFLLCPSLRHPDCIYDLQNGTLQNAFLQFTPRIRNMRSNKKEFLDQCHVCPLINLCMWCPANAFLEMGEFDSHVKYFCEIAHARAHEISKVRRTFNSNDFNKSSNPKFSRLRCDPD